MYFLSFETSTKIFSLALSRDEKVLRHRNLKAASVLEDAILPAVDKILVAANIKFNQIDGFAIALGPGSFTSLRVGLATIKAFAMSTGKPIVGIPSMDILAQGVANQDCDEICVLNDARRGKVYACLYKTDVNTALVPASQGPRSVLRSTDYLLTTIDDVLKRVQGKTLFVGDALTLYRKEIEQAYHHHLASKNTCKFLFADEKWWYPQSKVMAGIAFKRFEAKKYDDASKLLPIYLYPQDCQVNSTV